MNNIESMLYSLQRTAAIVKYNPTNCPNIAWHFPGTLNPEYIYCQNDCKPEVEDNQITIFDLNSGVWRIMLSDYVTLDHDRWYKHVNFKRIPLSYRHIIELVPEEMKAEMEDGVGEASVPEMDVYQWCCLSEEECDKCSVFDRQSYDRDIKNYIAVDCNQSGEVKWDQCFWAAQEDDFKATAEELNMNVVDFFVKCDDPETVSRCKQNWLDVITRTRDEAYIMLDKDLEHELTAHLYEIVIEEVYAEINMVRSLLDNVVEETRKMMDNCSDVFQILRTWPPILLPAPKFINISPMLSKQKILFVPGNEPFEIYDETIL